MHLLTAVLSFLAASVAWLVPAALATGGFDTYVSACLVQFQYRLDKPAVSVLGAPVSPSYITARAAALIPETRSPSGGHGRAARA
jgi:hypothetical protein